MPDSTVKPWAGRFAGATDGAVEAFTASVHFDGRLYPYDIAGSQAHARGLQKAGMLSAEECETLVRGLQKVRDDIEAGRIEWDPALEDVHMNIEARLVDEVGEVGKKLHTGRSRNDQVATDLRLYARDAQAQLEGRVHELQCALAACAEAEAETLMPGFTHLQTAQPITLGHHLLAWYEMLRRDRARLADAHRRTGTLPLGSAALAGSGYAVDRRYVAELLGFEAVSDNSLDAVSDRDFVVETCTAISLLMVHLSRMAEEIILWASPGFGFVRLPDALCTGSSLMPQKKNPDVLELIRGKSARVCGHVQALLMLMKAQPLAYNRDNQEDKEPLFDSVDTALGCVAMLAAVVQGMEFDRERMRQAAGADYAVATDLADALVARGIAFRDAHHATGRIVAHAAERGVPLHELDAAEVRAFSTAIDAELLAGLTPRNSVEARRLHGGTAPEQVRERAAQAQTELDAGPLLKSAPGAFG